MVKRLTNNGLHLFNNNKAKIDWHRHLLKNKEGINSKMNVKIKVVEFSISLYFIKSQNTFNSAKSFSFSFLWLY